MHLNAFFSRASPRLAIPEFLPEFKEVRWKNGNQQKGKPEGEKQRGKEGEEKEGKVAKVIRLC